MRGTRNETRNAKPDDEEWKMRNENRIAHDRWLTARSQKERKDEWREGERGEGGKTNLK